MIKLIIAFILLGLVFLFSMASLALMREKYKKVKKIEEAIIAIALGLVVMICIYNMNEIFWKILAK